MVFYVEVSEEVCLENTIFKGDGVAVSALHCRVNISLLRASNTFHIIAGLIYFQFSGAFSTFSFEKEGFSLLIRQRIPVFLSTSMNRPFSATITYNLFRRWRPSRTIFGRICVYLAVMFDNRIDISIAEISEFKGLLHKCDPAVAIAICFSLSLFDALIHSNFYSQ